MKTIILVIMFVTSTEVFSQNLKKYEIIDIDSTKNNYLVYVKSVKKKSLIISPKTDKIFNEKSKIKLGNKYKLKLKPFKLEFATILDEGMNNTITIDSKIVWRQGDDFDLFISKSLLGLHYNCLDDSTTD